MYRGTLETLPIEAGTRVSVEIRTRDQNGGSEDEYWQLALVNPRAPDVRPCIVEAMSAMLKHKGWTEAFMNTWVFNSFTPQPPGPFHIEDYVPLIIEGGIASGVTVFIASTLRAQRGTPLPWRTDKPQWFVDMARTLRQYDAICVDFPWVPPKQ